MSANESRRRADPPSQQKDDTSNTLVPFKYQKLDDEVDSTRFIRIEPAESETAPLVCSLTHVPFGDKPKFEALSYMWGDDNDQETITLNGCFLNVRKNLFDALRFLRSRRNSGFLWIDALCIDQNNIDERTKQVRNMGHIYFRAAAVIVWLGSKYSEYQLGLTDANVSQIVNPPAQETEKSSSDGDTEQENTETSVRTAERDMVRQLIADEYWNRVWIIQEVGKNETKRVCFGRLEVGWDDFIHFITMHNGKGGPLQLAQQLSQKYGDAHTLRRLLIDHKHARCKEPRDKIYGLVGLALDAREFPLDYEKSLLVVWNDTMEFMNRRRLFLANRETDIIFIGGLVKFLLMGAKCSPFQQISQQAEPQMDSQTIEEEDGKSSNPKVFSIKAYVLGCICYIGPTTQEMAANLRKTDEWAEQLQNHYGSDIGNAHKESNQLIRALLRASASETRKTCFNRVGLVKSEGNYGLFGWGSGVMPKYNDMYARYLNDTNDGTTAHPTSTALTSFNDVFLCQLYNGLDYNVPWKMGVVSGQARPTDLICWLKETKKAVVVRLHPKPGKEIPVLQVVGTALVTEDVAGEEVDHSGRCDFLETSIHDSANRRNTIDLKMDARTVFVLLPEED